MKRCSFIRLLVYSFIIAACQPATPLIRLIAPDGQELALRIEIADEPAEHARGLMFREELPEGTGMLFLFESEQILSFWMKSTLIPLDIVFFDRGGNYVSASTMEPCRDDPCPTYRSGGPAQYALEVTAGFVREHGVGEGWTLQLVPL